MADDTFKRGRSDSSRINLNEHFEVQYWTEKFDVTKEELVYAVQRVGSRAKDVEVKLADIERTKAGRSRSLLM